LSHAHFIKLTENLPRKHNKKLKKLKLNLTAHE
jgi:hypothetical protein